MGIQFKISFPLLILLVINYFGIPSVDKNFCQKFFSNEAFVGQGIGLCCGHFLFIVFPYFYIENYRIQEVENTGGQNNVVEEDTEVSERTRLIQREQ